MMRPLVITLVVLLAVPVAAGAETSPSAVQSDRIERHREMAEKRIHEHQAMTAAHIAGRTPVCPESDLLGENPVFFSPAFGESPMKPETDGEDDVSLNELRMYWQQWKELAAYASGKDPETFDKFAYGAAIQAQATSPTEVCRPASNKAP